MLFCIGIVFQFCCHYIVCYFILFSPFLLHYVTISVVNTLFKLNILFQILFNPVTKTFSGGTHKVIGTKLEKKSENYDQVFSIMACTVRYSTLAMSSNVSVAVFIPILAGIFEFLNHLPCAG